LSLLKLGTNLSRIPISPLSIQATILIFDDLLYLTQCTVHLCLASLFWSHPADDGHPNSVEHRGHYRFLSQAGNAEEATWLSLLFNKK
jgi:hypothetical protein